MTPVQKLIKRFKETFSLDNILPVILFMVLIVLLSITWPIWSDLFSKIKIILLPFVIGFILAYILRPIAVFFEKYKIPRALSVFVTIIGFLALIVLLFSLILPSMYDDMMQFATTIIDGIQKLYDYYKGGNAASTPLMDSLFKQALDSMDKIVGSVSNLPAMASVFIGKIFSALTLAMFSFVIGIYFIFDYEKISSSVMKKAHWVSPKLSASIRVVDQSVSSYLRSFAIIMPIIAIEYSLMYFLLGHNYALILGVLTALSLLIPYIGPMIVHAIGVLTALSMPTSKIVILIVMLMVLSNIDGYVTSPLIYSKRNKVEPLWSLFAFFAASTMFGFVGVLISMPLYLSIRSLLELKSMNWDLEKYEESRLS
ncbi:AI-2E family transporter [Erysipelothrix urinaevulpis]|uniref:AI-2E family transporter n=1 Tax=Erysipelothrix urinaevulpis TaxID=2683717 RepID=UPI00135CEEB8|nr:AI-2E family transporter [Erysipelothrix urinaevulpis]